MAHQQRSTAFVDVGLIERQRLRDPKSTTPQNRDQRPDPQSVSVVAGLAHHQDHLLRAWRVGRVPYPLVMWRATGEVPGLVAGERRRPAASSNTI
jgi:hypothetical protein